MIPDAGFVFAVASLNASLAGLGGLLIGLRRGDGVRPLDTLRLRQVVEFAFANLLLAISIQPFVVLVGPQQGFRMCGALALVFIVAAAAGGYRAGFVTRVLSWIGLGIGVAVAVTFGPRVLEPLAQTADPQIRALLTIGLFMAAASLGATLGEIVGLKLRRLIPEKLPSGEPNLIFQ